ncbi:TonB-dependent receptor [Hyphomicrobium sp.]|uniref:TonB-dependent receptor family protein n=1 Tax=Hyphomicrobium sp. TaxID=82 RepID=UPI002BBB2C27|nr:TonB-dependent receptor [Hyphomicrobium sp.]HRN89176.1 TonB-dependent receptor [Hyphomicrobium sp.]HRQ25611.1 TonB-dependent receptor [Hyphomicrobium sp.]
MLERRYLKLTVMAGAASLMTSPVFAQEAAQPAEGALPEVEVIQKKAPAPAAKKKAPAAPKQASPAPQPPPAYDYVDAEPAIAGPGQRGADGRVVSNSNSLSPNNPATGILPTDLQDFPGAATRVTSEEISEQRPKDTHELLTRVPGVMVIADDGASRHANIGVRGSPTRRSRKVLIMEDGVPINFSTYLDPSTHYTPPVHRVESVEVFRGPIVAYGPLNNHGVINFRNLNPFGANETVISAAIGHTDGVKDSTNNYRHVHTRQNLGPVGVVVSYSGEDAGGAWDNETQRYNDFYGAIGFRGSNQDLTISGGYFRQRDNYDETNFRYTEADFFANGRRKSQSQFFDSDHEVNRQTDLNTYNADLFRIQAAHNWYINSDTTLTTRAYYSENERDRFQARRDSYMRGRERTYEVFGAESRIEFANVPLFAGMTQDIQAGIRYEHHQFRNCNSVGLGFNANEPRQILKAGDDGNCRALEDRGGGRPNIYRESGQLNKFEADAFSAFIQTAIHVNRNLTITPGLRFENYDIDRTVEFAAVRIAPGVNTYIQDPATPFTVQSDHDYVLPMIAFAWEAAPRTTIYGGFHQGVTPQVARGPSANTYPLPEETGDNYEIGVRSTAIRGVTLDLAYFHNNIDNYQVKEAGVDALGNSRYGTVEEVEINGFEIYGRLDSQPFTGGPWNFFAEAAYTYSDSEITKSVFAAEVGNQVPEVPRQFANLTLGFAHQSGFDISVTGTYRGDFFTDTVNTRAWTCYDEDAGLIDPCAGAGGDVETVVGKIDAQWLLSARANYLVPNTNLTLFVSGQNLTNEFYVADMSGGAKPGVGRTLWAGFTWKFDHD